MKPLDSRRKALLLVDLQNDFFPKGALAVPRGDEILPTLNKILASKKYACIVATKDWHPENHVSFAKTHGKKALEKMARLGAVLL